MVENPDTASHISPNDPVGVIFGKEHPGRVRGLSYGVCPTLAFRKSTTGVSNMNNGSSSGGSSTNVEEKVENMATELAVVRSQMHTMLAYIASRPDVPEHFAQIWYKHLLTRYKLLYLKFYYNIVFIYFLKIVN